MELRTQISQDRPQGFEHSIPLFSKIIMIYLKWNFFTGNKELLSPQYCRDCKLQNKISTYQEVHIRVRKKIEET